VRIRDVCTQPAVRAGGPKRREGASSVQGAAPVGSAVDQIEFSGNSFEVQRARALALQAPEIREEMVGEIVAQIRQGRYVIVGAQVAPRMIREHLVLR
jgi:anti-sigma28 factor (negative regulator of flagellin synthesis)